MQFAYLPILSVILYHLNEIFISFMSLFMASINRNLEIFIYLLSWPLICIYIALFFRVRSLINYLFKLFITRRFFLLTLIFFCIASTSLIILSKALFFSIVLSCIIGSSLLIRSFFIRIRHISSNFSLIISFYGRSSSSWHVVSLNRSFTIVEFLFDIIPIFLRFCFGANIVSPLRILRFFVVFRRCWICWSSFFTSSLNFLLPLLKSTL